LPQDIPAPQVFIVPFTDGKADQLLEGPIYSIEVQADTEYDIGMRFTEEGEFWTIYGGSTYSREFTQPWPTIHLHFTSEVEGNVQIILWKDLSEVIG
jgi:hypothetical protein